MFAKASSVLAALALVGLTGAQSSSSTYSADQSTSTACPSQGGAHIIVSRGSLEGAPYGTLVKVKDGVLAQVPGSTADGTVGYPDTLDNYMVSESDGVEVARALITDYVSRCPGLPLVLMGYSQGANVLGDSLIGQDDNAFADNSTIDTPLPSAVLSQVAALIFMGDPTFVTTESFHVGNATKNGSFPRQNAALFESTGLASVAQSYCDANDLFCAGGTSILVHVGYVPEYGNDAIAFVVKQIAAWYAAHPSSGASTTKAAPTATGTLRPPKSSISACASASSGAVRPRPASSSGAVPPGPASSSGAATSTASMSSTATSTSVVSTGAASINNVDMTIVAGAGAVFAGLFAAFL